MTNWPQEPVEGKSPTDESILQKLVEKMGGEVHMAEEREDHVPLYDHHVVAPLIMKETDIPSAAVRNALLEKRTSERCKGYLLQRKRLRKGGNGKKISGRKILTMVQGGRGRMCLTCCIAKGKSDKEAQEGNR